MDTRIINIGYSKPAIEMFVAAAQLCLQIPLEEGPPNPPEFVEGTGHRMLRQAWGEEPATSGVGVFYSLAEDGETVQLWDCEEQGYDVEELGPPLYTFPLSQFTESMLKWAKGEL